MNGIASSPSLAAQWRSVRRLYPIYAALADKFELGEPPFPDLNNYGSKSEAEVIARVQDWLAEMDARIQPHQFRQMLQSSGFADVEEKLLALVRRHLEKSGHGDADRDKLDFLLTHYVSVCAPPSFQARELSLEEIAQVLEPVLGEIEMTTPEWLEPLEPLILQMRHCGDLEQFDSLGIVQRGRALKASAGERFFTSTALLLFTRFTYLLRCTFARLFAAEAQRIDQGLQQLEARGVAVVDGTGADLSPEEPIATIRELLYAATTSAAPAYSADNTSKRLRGLRAAIERSLARTNTTTTDVPARFERLELELQELRSVVALLRQQCEQLRACVEHQPVAAATTRSASNRPEPQSPQSPPVQQPAPAATEERTPTTGSGVIPAVPQVDFTAEVQQCLARVRKSLRAPGSRPTGVLRIRNGTLLLSEGELQLLQSNPDANDGVTRIMETAVGTRALLVEQCELGKAGKAVDFALLLRSAREVLGELQRLGGMHGPHHDVIAGSARQLWSVIQQADRTAREVRARDPAKEPKAS